MNFTGEQLSSGCPGSMPGDLYSRFRSFFLRRILVVDDDPLVCELVSRALGDAYQITLAEHGKQALALLDDKEYDMMILDIIMPEMDGWETLRLVRAEPKTAFMPVMFLTGRGGHEEKVKGFRLGADDYLEKPFLGEELRLRVSRMLDRVDQMIRPDEGELTEDNGFQGSLKEFGVAPVLTLLSMENKTGFLHLDKAGKHLILFLRDGQIVRGRTRGNLDATSYQTVYRALSWKRGNFHFVNGLVDGEDELNQSTSQLLLDVARAMDESKSGVEWQEDLDVPQ